VKCPHCGKKLPGAHRGPSPKERAFVAHWLTNGNNGTEAARSAGYRGKDDNVLAVTLSRLLRRAHVQTLVEQASLPTTELVMQVLREVGLTADENHARVAAARVLARIEGMIARHEHAHLHAHLDLPAVGSPEARSTRCVRALVRLLESAQRAQLLDDLASSSAVPALPAVSTVRSVGGRAEEEGGRGGGSGRGASGPT